MSNAMYAIPLGARYLASPPASRPANAPISYSANLQLTVSAAGNPYHLIAASLAETNTETDTGDGQRPGSDNSTDNY